MKRTSGDYTEKISLNWQSTFDSIKDPIMILDCTFTITTVNEAFVSFIGLPREKILGKSCYHLVHGTNKPFVSCPIMKMIKTKNNEETEIYLDDRGVWLLVTVNPIFDEFGIVIGAVHIFTDITSRKKAEYTLKTSERRYRRLFETAQDGILILDAITGEIDDVNPYLINMLGYTHEEFMGKKLWEIGAFKNIEENKTQFLELQDEGYIRYEDLPLVTKTGKEIAVEFVSNVYKVNGSRVIQCNIRNITARKCAEKKQKISDDKYRSIVENAVEGIFQTTPEGKVSMVNPALARMMGYGSPEDLLRGIIELSKPAYVKPEDRVRYMTMLEEKGIVQGFETQHYRKDGSIIWVSINARSVRDMTGKILYHEGTVEDINARKTADEILKRHSENLRRSLVGTIKALSMTVETRDPYTSGHQGRVSVLARAIAQDMSCPVIPSIISV